VKKYKINQGREYECAYIICGEMHSAQCCHFPLVRRPSWPLAPFPVARYPSTAVGWKKNLIIAFPTPKAENCRARAYCYNIYIIIIIVIKISNNNIIHKFLSCPTCTILYVKLKSYTLRDNNIDTNYKNNNE